MKIRSQITRVCSWLMVSLAVLGVLLRGASLVQWCRSQHGLDRERELVLLCEGGPAGDRSRAAGTRPEIDPIRCVHEVDPDSLRRSRVDRLAAVPPSPSPIAIGQAVGDRTTDSVRAAMPPLESAGRRATWVRRL